MATKDIIEAYMAAWNETDEGKRGALIDQCWNESGTYIDPVADVGGREGLASLIASSSPRCRALSSPPADRPAPTEYVSAETNRCSQPSRDRRGANGRLASIIDSGWRTTGRVINGSRTLPASRLAMPVPLLQRRPCRRLPD
jgi:hypothetical protein